MAMTNAQLRARDRELSQLVRAALARYKTQALAAKHVGITQSTVARRAKQYGLESQAS